MPWVARPLRLILIIVALAGVVVLTTASRCLACSCVAATPAELFEDADAAFVGQVVSSTVGETGTTQVFEVEGVHKGELGSTVEVWAAIGGGSVSSCAVLFPEHDRIAVLLQRTQGRWEASACSLTSVRSLERVAGPPTSPLKDDPAPEPGGPAPDLGTDPGTREGMPRWSVPLLGGLLGIAAIWIASMVASRRQRRAELARAAADPAGSPHVADEHADQRASGDPAEPAGG